MRSERCLDASVAGPCAGELLEWMRVVVEPQRRAAGLELAGAERGRGRGPHRPVAGDRLRAQVRAEGDQLREVVDGLDGPALLDADETVRIQVVPEQQRRVAVLRREQPRPPVVKEIALVERLDPEGVAVFAEWGEDGLALLLVSRAQRRRPELALAAGLSRDRVPQVSSGSPTGHVSGPWAAAKFRQAASSAAPV